MLCNKSLLLSLLSLLSQSLLVFFLCISRAQTMHLERQSHKSNSFCSYIIIIIIIIIILLLLYYYYCYYYYYYYYTGAPGYPVDLIVMWRLSHE